MATIVEVIHEEEAKALVVMGRAELADDDAEPTWPAPSANKADAPSKVKARRGVPPPPPSAE